MSSRTELILDVKYSMNSMTVNDGAAVEGATIERPRKLLIVDHSSLES